MLEGATSRIQRRSVVKGAAWAVPVIAATAAAPWAAAASVNCPPGSATLDTFGTTTVRIPSCVTTVTYTIRGGGGGGGAVGNGSPTSTFESTQGGSGATITGTLLLPATGSDTLLTFVAGNGGLDAGQRTNTPGAQTSGFGNGGLGMREFYNLANLNGTTYSGGGGGGSAILFNGQPVVVAGGGGGGGNSVYATAAGDMSSPGFGASAGAGAVAGSHGAVGPAATPVFGGSGADVAAGGAAGLNSPASPGVNSNRPAPTVGGSFASSTTGGGDGGTGGGQTVTGGGVGAAGGGGGGGYAGGGGGSAATYTSGQATVAWAGGGGGAGSSYVGGAGSITVASASFTTEANTGANNRGRVGLVTISW